MENKINDFCFTADSDSFCVYAHFKHNEDVPFYIGKGRLSRAYSNIGRLNSWKAAAADGYMVSIIAVFSDSQEKEAFELEASLIATHWQHLVNANVGRSKSYADRKLAKKRTSASCDTTETKRLLSAQKLGNLKQAQICEIYARYYSKKSTIKELAEDYGITEEIIKLLIN